MKNLLYKNLYTFIKKSKKIGDKYLDATECYRFQTIKTNFSKASLLSLGYVTFVLATSTSCFAMIEDEKAQFVSYLNSRHWRFQDDKAKERVFPIPLPSYDIPRSTQEFRSTRFSYPRSIKYDGDDLRYRKERERTFYEGEVNGEKISLDVKLGQGGISLIGNNLAEKTMDFGAQSFILRGKAVIFESERSTKSFFISSPEKKIDYGLLDYLKFIRDRWKGSPILTYEGTLGEESLEMIFPLNELHPLTPTTVLYALDTDRCTIGVFVKIELPNFGFQFEELAVGDLPFDLKHSPCFGQIYYDGDHIYPKVSQTEMSLQTPSLEWLKKWGPQLINGKSPGFFEKLSMHIRRLPESHSWDIPWEAQLKKFKKVTRNPNDALERMFIDPYDQQPVVGGKRKEIDPGYYKDEGPVKKRARIIYRDREGKLSIAHKEERKWAPVKDKKKDPIDPGGQPFTVNTYVDTGISWDPFDDVTSSRNWLSGFYRETGDSENDQMIWEKMDDTLSTGSTTYLMSLGQHKEIGKPLKPEGMTSEAFVDNILYYQINYFHKSDEIFDMHLENNTLRLKFKFSDKNIFENFVKFLKNENIKNNINTLQLRYDNCPPFTPEMSATLGACLAEFSSLAHLEIDIPYVLPFRNRCGSEQRFGIISDFCDWTTSTSYEQHLILAKNLGKSSSLQTINFHGVGWQYDQTNIRSAIKNTTNNIVVDFK